MAQHLMGLGHTRIAFVGEDPDNRAAVERYLGVKRAVESDSRAELVTVRCPANSSVRRWASTVDSVLRMPERPTALIMVNDITAITAIQRCKAVGLGVPEDISVVGFGNLMTASVIEPALTTFAENVPGIVNKIVEALTRKIADPQCESIQSLVPQKMLRRKSSAPPPRRIKIL